MKNAVIFLVSLLSLQAMADARVGDHMVRESGFVKVWGMRNILNVQIGGQAAKVLFDNLVDAKEEQIRRGSLFTTVRSGDMIRCSFSAEVTMTYSCTLHVDVQGDVTAGTQAFTRDHRPDDVSVNADGDLIAGGMRGTLNVVFQGDTARLIYENLKNVQEKKIRGIAMYTTVRQSDAIQAIFTDGVQPSYQVDFNMDQLGRITAGTIAWPM